VPFQNHLEFILKTLPSMMLRLIADITNGESVIVKTQSSLRDSHSRVEQLPGTPLTLRAGLLSGRAYRHFVYTMTTESLQRQAPSYAIDEAGSSCLSEHYWG
jgi:hypothetical protein